MYENPEDGISPAAPRSSGDGESLSKLVQVGTAFKQGEINIFNDELAAKFGFDKNVNLRVYGTSADSDHYRITQTQGAHLKTWKVTKDTSQDLFLFCRQEIGKEVWSQRRDARENRDNSFDAGKMEELKAELGSVSGDLPRQMEEDHVYYRTSEEAPWSRLEVNKSLQGRVSDYKYESGSDFARSVIHLKPTGSARIHIVFRDDEHRGYQENDYLRLIQRENEIDAKLIEPPSQSMGSGR